MSSAYHPQSDGQTERVNQCLETYLRCFVHSCPTKWSGWLPLAEYWYNTSLHSAIGCSPFEALYGHAPRHLGLSDAAVCSAPELETWLHEHKDKTELLKQLLERARQRMKHQAAKRRSEREFSMGDWVYLCLQPYVQTSIATRANRKLSFRYFGPFQVLERVGAVAYKLALPPSSSIHPVFHVSQLKQALPPQVVAEQQLPATPDPALAPVAVLDRHLYRRGPKAVNQVLIQWEWDGLPASLATWENEAKLRHRFPSASAWGQAVPQGGKDVTTTATPSASKQTVEAEAPEDQAGGNGSRRGNRVKKPNHLFPASDWAQ